MLSIVIPAYNEEKLIAKTTKCISTLLLENNIHFEIIFVDDGSKDQTWDRIMSESKTSKYINGIKFSRNFGKEAAIFAGLSEAQGECVVIIDCDLQQPPEKIIDMYELWKNGYDIVEGIKKTRGKESLSYRFFSNCFYGVISKSIDIDMKNSSDFKLLDKKVVQTLLNIHERDTFFRGLSSWIGFSTAKVYYDVHNREIGKSKWSFLSLFKYAIRSITSFTSLPMQFITLSGVITLIFSIILTVNSLVQKISGQAVEGFTTIIIIQCFMGSILMISIGIIGIYISKIFNEVQRRPRYIIEKRISKNMN